MLVAVGVTPSVQSVHPLLVLPQRVLKRITLDVQVLVTSLPEDGAQVR